MLGAALVLVILVAGVGFGFVQLGRPAVAWVNEAPEHMEKLRQRVQSIFKHAAWVNQTAAVSALGTTDEEQKKPAIVVVKDTPVPTAFLNWSRINWTGTLLAMVGETHVLLYLLLASGDLFLQKLAHVMPTMSDKKRAGEINHELQQNISNYLFSVSLVNIGLGLVVSGGLWLFGVPNAAMWGLLVAVLNFVPYFGPSRASSSWVPSDSSASRRCERDSCRPPGICCSICGTQTSSPPSCWAAASPSTRW